MVRRILALRHVVLLLAIAVSAPSVVAASWQPRGPQPAEARVAAVPAAGSSEQPLVAAAPNLATIGDITFALDRVGDSPVNTGTSFAFGPRRVYAFVSYSGAGQGERIHVIFRFLGSDPPTDVNFGDVDLRPGSGTAVIALERMDADYLMIGTFELVVEQGGRELGRRSFEIFDEGDRGDGDGDDNDNGGDGGDNDGDDNS